MEKKKSSTMLLFSFPCITIIILLLLLLAPTSTISSPSSSSSRCTEGGSNATTIYDALSNNALPRGLFPKGVTEFEVGADGRFWVHLEQACNAMFESELHYERNVSGSLSCGKIDALAGMEAQDLFLWLPVVSIYVDVPSPGLIRFDVGAAFKQFSSSLFETPPDCVAVLPDRDVDRRIPRSAGQLGRLQYQPDHETSGRDVL